MNIDEIVTGIELLGEQQGRFTVPQLLKIVSPGSTTADPPYYRMLRGVQNLAARGDLIQEPTRDGPSLVFTIAPGGINRKGLAEISLTNYKKSKSAPVKAANHDEFVRVLAGAPCPSMDEIHQALESEFVNSPEGVTVQCIHKRFPGSNLEEIRIRLKVLESEGMVQSVKRGLARFYHPKQIDRPIPLPSAKPVRAREIKRVRLFPCEVCPDVAIPAAARSTPYTIPCNSCQSVYLIEGNEAYRLGPGIKIQIWVPGSSNDLG